MRFNLLVLLFISFIITTANPHLSRYDDEQAMVSGKDVDFEAAWKRIDSLSKIGLSKSVLEELDKIYILAKKEKNAPQIVKICLFQLNFEKKIEENHFFKAVERIKSEIASNPPPLRNIFHSILAEMYTWYYNGNQWAILERPRVQIPDETNIDQWDALRFMQEIHIHHQNAISDKKALSTKSIREFDPILIKGKNTAEMRKSLFQFLAFRALEFYQSSSLWTVFPNNSSLYQSENIFADSKSFIQQNFNGQSQNLHPFDQAILLFQMLSSQTICSTQLACLDADLLRLKFAHLHSKHPKSDSLYQDRLERMISANKDNAFSATLQFELAQHFYDLGNQYDALTSRQFKWEKQHANKLCSTAIRNYPKSRGAALSNRLQLTIQSKSLALQSESVLPVDKAFKMLFNFKNVDSVRLSIIPIQYNEIIGLRRFQNEEILSLLNSKKKFKEWTTHLPNDGDFQNHSTELIFPGLPSGGYAVLATSDDKSIENRIQSYATFWVSNLVGLSRNLLNGQGEFRVLNRNSGDPMRNVEIELLKQEYRRGLGKMNLNSQFKGKTDKEGTYVHSASTNQSLFAFYKTKNDSLFDLNAIYFGPLRRNNLSIHQDRTFIFTDRSIYRPGQSIYLKGIVVRYEGDNRSIVSDTTLTVECFDQNNQSIGKRSVTTNAYGSYSTTFQLPVGMLPGSIRIYDGLSSVNTSVEEYKRPKFEVELLPPKEAYRINSKVKIPGVAKTYNGNPITDAEVIFAIYRTSIQPRYPWFRYSIFPPAVRQEISTGRAITDQKGNFELEFQAMPDNNGQYDERLYYDFEVEAKVLDKTGEIQQNAIRIPIGNKALKISTSIKEAISAQDMDSIVLNTRSLSGTFQASSGNFSISKLIVPNELQRDRYWRQPDTNTISERQFKTLFPNDIYASEDDIRKWKVETSILDQRFNTAKASRMALNPKTKWIPGKYRLQVNTKDAFGEEVVWEQYFDVYDPNSTKHPGGVFWFHDLNVNCEPGEEAEILIGTSANQLPVFYEVEHKGQIVSSSTLSLSNGQKLIKFPVLEKHRGNFIIHLMTIYNNRKYSIKQEINVPYSNKQLDVKLRTFRDVMEPGSKEKWTIEVQGKQKKIKDSEVLVSMYDASLDAFGSNAWHMNIYPKHRSRIQWNWGSMFRTNRDRPLTNFPYPNAEVPAKKYDRLNWFNYHYWGGSGIMPMFGKANRGGGVQLEMASMDDGDAIQANSAGIRADQNSDSSDEKVLEIREDFSETAFFYPHLLSKDSGQVQFEFTLPQSLTRWKFNALAHSKELDIGFFSTEVQAKKELSVEAFAPRFFRAGDTLTFNAKISKLEEELLRGRCTLKIYGNGKDISQEVLQNEALQEFVLDESENKVMSWNLIVPRGLNFIQYELEASTSNHSDAERKQIPVLANRELITESLALPIRGYGERKFTFKNLANSAASSSLKNHRLTFEYTANPAWYALQALPYLLENNHEGSEQIFSRFYANLLGQHIVNSTPSIKDVFESWQKQGSQTLQSNLRKNGVLKSVLLDESPWVQDAQDEEERKARLALYFNQNNVDAALNQNLSKLENMQLANGAWPWFPGMRENRYITQHIVSGFGHIKQLNSDLLNNRSNLYPMISKAIRYLDLKIKEDYNRIRTGNYDEKNQYISPIHIQYLYARSVFNESIDAQIRPAHQFFMQQAKAHWLKQNKYMQGMLALVFHRKGEENLAKQILASIKEHALYSEEEGMYWKKENRYGWQSGGIEMQALLIEAFSEITQDAKAVEEMKIWLLKRKQVENWKSTKATTEAIFALLLRNNNLLAETHDIQLQLGNTSWQSSKDADAKIERGSGYVQKSWYSDEISADFGQISLNKITPKQGDSAHSISWGAVHWQYFEELDKLPKHESGIAIKRQLFVKRYDEKGSTLFPVKGNQVLKVGDEIVIRMTLRVDRDMEYIHLKDARATGMEPLEFRSGYRFESGLGFYKSIRDASMHFFFERIPKGQYFIDYTLRATVSGNVSSSYAKVQNMYAPEFNAHSEGMRLTIEP